MTKHTKMLHAVLCFLGVFNDLSIVFRQIIKNIGNGSAVQAANSFGVVGNTESS